MKNHLDWSEYENAGMGDAYADIPKTGGDYAKAIAVCIGSRQCETKGSGVMCPSYRVTEKPEFSTGGRVRMLKAALNGELGPTPFADPQLAEAMDLCVSCKGCKRECENEVDMSRIKIEYLAQRNALTGVSLRTRLFADLPWWLHRRPWLKKLVALRNRIPLIAKIGERLLGVNSQMAIPEPSSDAFSAEPHPHTTQVTAGPRLDQEVVLFVDTFADSFEPEIARAAREVLQAAGYEVIIARPHHDTDEPGRPLCCGRTFLAHGLIEEARAEAQRTLDVLAPYADAGYPIIGLEPSCILSLRDEHLALGLGEAARRVAPQVMLFEEFLAKEYMAKRLNLDLTSAAELPPVLVHGHCHQKAVGAMKSMRRVLKLIPNLKFELINSSCCGMAGSFGLEQEHATHAKAMAEDALLPALREAPESPVVANGFSCRHQIRQNSERQPRHIALLLRDLLPQRAAG